MARAQRMYVPCSGPQRGEEALPLGVQPVRGQKQADQQLQNICYVMLWINNYKN